ncbi:PREDICTED: xaa-Pro aminopeptidase 1 [Nicrophorus vespilloides]|uniref:Xaa-Pro aminopeptidase 1 n=1 Tax=Nicrophorus vespilloides TaxID=110193 RepID=A0ABM1ND90_NICVS|nr:PREDICTED: xaa-Pro aminopeptidase 1 [Nicrophorus vespilloides]
MSQPKSTTALLLSLRAHMQKLKEPLSAYIVPSADAHASEYLAECDKRRAFISGFTGSAGTAIVTQNHACMWTDGRYYLQASEEMDSNWKLMKEGVPSTPSQGTWLSTSLPSGSTVGVDPNLISYNRWLPLREQLESAGHKLIPVETNLIDLVWDNKPSAPLNPVLPLPLMYTGLKIGDKLKAVREKMREKNASIVVLTFLDEIAWFLNLRGSDIEFNPVFFSYVIIKENSFTVFMDPKQYTPTVEEHLKEEVGNEKFVIKNYDTIKEVLKENMEGLAGKVWVSNQANYSIFSVIPKKSIIDENTPVQLFKAIKNPVERQGMRNAHIKDGVALCSYFSWLEKNVSSETITEISGANKLEAFRAEQNDYVGPSFDTISSVGPHGAIIHYKPTSHSDIQIKTNCIYLCDSGGQYKDGTTDVTRTMHFGTPTEYERECFTRVLKGQINLGTSVFPTKIKGNCLDAFARKFLWDVGLDYAHGTGHGIGSYLNVHEGPMEVSWRTTKDDPGLEAGMFISNEPGFYEDGKFGIRIEDIVEIVVATPPHNFNNRGYLTFDTITLAPIQTKMIRVDMLTEKELGHLNRYHKKCRDILGPILEQQGKTDVKEWLWKETEPLVAS